MRTLVVLEGHDGVGKTSLANALAQALRVDGFVAEVVSSIPPCLNGLRDRVDAAADLNASLRFYVAATLLSLTEITTASEADVVIMDRYIYSTLVSHRARGCPVSDHVLSLVPIPDVAFWVTASEPERRRRVSSRHSNDRKAHDHLVDASPRLLSLADEEYSRLPLMLLDNTGALEDAEREAHGIILSAIAHKNVVAEDGFGDSPASLPPNLGRPK